MNSLERFVATLKHEKPDRVPAYPLVNSVSRKILGISYEEWSKDVDKCAECIIGITDELDLDCITTLVDLSVEAADFGQEIIYFEDKAACPSEDKLIKSVEDYDKIKFVDPTKPGRMKDNIDLTKIIMEKRGKEKAVASFVFGPLGVLSMLRGLDKMLMDLYDAPEQVHKALKEVSKTIFALSDALVDTGVHAIMFDTLYASSNIMSEEMWDEFEGQYMQEIADHVIKRGCMTMIHSCGNGPYFDAQINRMHPSAFSFLYWPNNCSSYEEMAEKYGNKLALIGCVPPAFVMTASEDEIVAECKKQIDIFKDTNSFTLATGCEYPALLDFERAKIMVDVAKTYGKY